MTLTIDGPLGAGLVALVLIAYTYLWIGLTMAVVCWMEAERPQWRVTHWARVLLAAPTWYLVIIVQDWRREHFAG